VERYPVLLTFDVDAESLWISRDPNHAKKPVIMSQGRYGVTSALPRILKLLKTYNIPSSFFVPGWVIERHSEAIKQIVNEGHEIGHHGYLHEWPDTLNYEQEKEIMEKGIDIIQKLTGSRPKGYRSPAWEFSPNTLEFLKEYGFVYSSNMMDSDEPYIHE
jgi:peptidoglycan/xylan/chitin deacetylase (PgdA/CDA1 family)